MASRPQACELAWVGLLPAPVDVDRGCFTGAPPRHDLLLLSQHRLAPGIGRHGQVLGVSGTAMMAAAAALVVTVSLTPRAAPPRT